MGFKLQDVIPWGRCLEEYSRMFDLKLPALRNQRLLDCAGGPASFNAEMTHQGYSVISCDPIYQFSTAEIAQQIQATYETVIQGVTENQADYLWTIISSPQALGVMRMAAMSQFLADFDRGKEVGRYHTGGLPNLPFKTQEFDLALCSHFLFSYSDHFSLGFHIDSVLELCRVAQEVRIFPLITISGNASPWVPGVIDALMKQGYQSEIQQVSYEFQKGGHQMLKITPHHNKSPL